MRTILLSFASSRSMSAYREDRTNDIGSNTSPKRRDLYQPTRQTWNPRITRHMATRHDSMSPLPQSARTPYRAQVDTPRYGSSLYWIAMRNGTISPPVGRPPSSSVYAEKCADTCSTKSTVGSLASVRGHRRHALCNRCSALSLHSTISAFTG